MNLRHYIVAIVLGLGASLVWVQPLLAAKFVNIESGARHTCGMTDTGRIYCWGREAMGQGRYPLVASDIYRDFTATTLGSGTHQGFAIDAAGKVICWGENDVNQCKVVPEQLLSISGADRHACGVNDRQAIYCWGSDEHMNLSSFNGGTFSAVASGYFHSCGLTVDGNVICAGCERGGSERRVDLGQCDVPDESQSKYVAVAAGRVHTCLLNEVGQVDCFGASKFGQTSVPSGVVFSQIVAGSMHTCGIEKGRGRVHCWGRNSEGQSDTPDDVFVDVAAGFKMSCGLRESGEVVCWGEDSEGFITPPNPNSLQ